MKTITIISIVLFVLAASILGISLVLAVSRRMAGESGTVVGTAPEASLPHEESQQELTTEEVDRRAVTSVEIYLDGDRDNGIFLGQAAYPVESPEAAALYGEAFSLTGYRLVWENTDLAFAPGSVHYLYVYAYIPEYGWQYIREEAAIPGEAAASDNIFLFIDGPKERETVSGQFDIRGWSADRTVFENPSIASIEVYLNGPRDFGKFLGNASLGLQRPDVVDVLGNENYLPSGYSFSFDASGLEPGSLNTFYVYSFSAAGEYNLEKIDLWAEGTKRAHAPIFLESDFAEMLPFGTFALTGWALPKEVLPSD